jgi:hypothetical protein
MSLFTIENIDRFREEPRIKRALGGIILLNCQEFEEWFEPDVSRQSIRVKEAAARIGDKAVEELELRRAESAEYKTNITKEILKQLAVEVCGIDPKTGATRIGQEYGEQAVESLEFSNFDLLVAVDSLEYDPIGKTEIVSNRKLANVVGFIIAEKGECHRKPHVWSVNLICTRKKINGNTVKGIILLGAFIYCIKNSPDRNEVQEGILELAKGYKNTAGFISYTKIGFNKDLSLFGPHPRTKVECFHDFTNLPMSVIIRDLDNETILNRIAELERRIVTDEEDDSGIYNAGKIDPALQERLIVLNDLLYKLEMAYDLVQANVDSLYPEEKALFEDLQKTFKKNRAAIIGNLKEQRVEIMRQIAQTKQSATIPPTGVVTALPPVTTGEFIVQCWNNICRTVGLKGGKKYYKRTHKKRNKKICNKKTCNKKVRKHSNRRTRNKK